MRTVLIGAMVLTLTAGGAAAADLGSSGATNWDGRTAAPSAGSTQTYTYGTGSTTVTTTTTTTTLYPPAVPLSGYTPYGPGDYRTPDQGDSGVSPRASQMPTGSHCPPGTPDCGGANR